MDSLILDTNYVTSELTDLLERLDEAVVSDNPQTLESEVGELLRTYLFNDEFNELAQACDEYSP